jgi:hypothetical protein
MRKLRKPSRITLAEIAEHELLVQKLRMLGTGQPFSTLDGSSTAQRDELVERISEYIMTSRRNSADYIHALREVYQQWKEIGRDLTHYDLGEVIEKMAAIEEDRRREAALPLSRVLFGNPPQQSDKS